MTPPPMKMDRWSTDREEIVRFLRCHPIFRFVVTFCLCFTVWSLLDLLFPPISMSYRSHDIGALFVAAVLASFFSFLERRRVKRQSKSHRDSTSVI
jgi:membrane associated rhomboid family serine protease